MSASNQRKNLHLLWRAGFGPAGGELAGLDTAGPVELFRNMLTDSQAAPAVIQAMGSDYQDMMAGVANTVVRRGQLSAEQRKALRVQSREGIKSLNLAWMNQMVNSRQQLREKMSLFWHGHFASRNINMSYQQKLLDVIRQHALGNFGDLLKAVSKSASMINFLNNNQNRKNHPNENFAREVMELFTLGRGNYTENDIKESARAFTGWGADFNGEFVFRERQHDDGEKTFLGRSGAFNGDDILKIILEQKQAARFICKKLYAYFVNTEVDDAHVEWLADRFYKNHYDITPLVTDIFTADWFYADRNMGVRIKSPVELLVGIRRMLPMQIQNEASQLLLQRLLGQILFYPPNVAGWPGGRSWIDSSTLMLRLRIPELIYAGDNVNMKPKDDDDQMMGMRERDGADGDMTDQKMRNNGNGYAQRGQRVAANIDWTAYLDYFKPVSRENLLQALSALLLTDAGTFNTGLLGRYTDSSSRESFIKTATIRLMGTPEYQLC